METEDRDYDLLIQYMVEHGYFYSIPANERKGNPKISDSFGTID